MSGTQKAHSNATVINATSQIYFNETPFHDHFVNLLFRLIVLGFRNPTIRQWEQVQLKFYISSEFQNPDLNALPLPSTHWAPRVNERCMRRPTSFLTVEDFQQYSFVIPYTRPIIPVLICMRHRQGFSSAIRIAMFDVNRRVFADCFRIAECQRRALHMSIQRAPDISNTNAIL